MRISELAMLWRQRLVGAVSRCWVRPLTLALSPTKNCGERRPQVQRFAAQFFAGERGHTRHPFPQAASEEVR